MSELKDGYIYEVRYPRGTYDVVLSIAANKSGCRYFKTERAAKRLADEWAAEYAFKQNAREAYVKQYGHDPELD